ncbi:MAG: pantetheine-phosphate adenylyltransferase [Planctomycetota bacterium]|jgi:pantetheine-phosphate adenylyltransferase
MHALFPGTFDPVTLGHLDVLERALRLFDRVTLAVAEHHAKDQLFDLEERQALLREVTSGWKGVEVVTLSGLLVDGCRELGAGAIVRGVRSAADLDYERQMAFTNRAMAPDVETVFLLTAPECQHISSTLVRQIARMGGDVSSFVPPAVQTALARHLSEQANR